MEMKMILFVTSLLILVIPQTIVTPTDTLTLYFYWYHCTFKFQNSSVVKNESAFVGNETVYENVTVFGTSMADNPDFEMYRLVYALTILAILSTNIIRGLVYAKVRWQFLF